jgi:16S rRNA (guanine966-N2)-methyltransferase
MSDPGGERPFDLVLLDPPYADPDLESCLAQVAGWVAADGMLVLEHARRRVSPPTAGGLVRVRVVQSGDSALSFYRHDSADVPTAGSNAPSSS